MESPNLLTIIRQCTLFKNIDDLSSYLLLHYGKIRLFAAGETIFKKGDFSRGAFGLIVSGQVGIISDTGQVIRGMGSGEILGELGVTSPQNKRTATVKAIKPTELFEWNVDMMKTQLPEIMKRLKDLAWKNASNYYE
ncbi:thyroid receptor-interacting protein, putative [Candidatus Moduliflexus flocculans]|uniref:Thyroid receptor-interacting protein, putative n=1 Tax=Candidatus Moduliflexus flocculans TaxID=1499966 RepID=A0A0S6VPI8_9BACT|nr:thyroid receptor-interacting protein, putative [Candidatus Moduliflexus flocculans]